MIKKVCSFIICCALAISILLMNPIDSKALSGNEPTYTYWVQDSSTLQKNNHKVKMIEWISIDGRKSKVGTVKYVTIKKKGDK